jgi:hypothetical protein
MRHWIYTLTIFWAFCSSGCIEPYTPPEILSNDDYLVVEGYLDAAAGSSTIKLSRTIPLSGSDGAEPVTDAVVVIEDETNRRYLFLEQDYGIYVADNIPVNSDTRYRLRIVDGSDEYNSEYVEVVQTPEIDSVSWRIEDNKIRVYVSTHNEQQGTRYYLWRFNETWEYNSGFRSYFEFENGLIKVRPSPVEIYNCWKTQPSTLIHIASTLAQQQDAISDYLLQEYDLNAKQFQTKYSIQVQQFSLTKEAYGFWSQVRDNTQSTGTLFDKQPSRVTGNISNENGKPAIGYFTVCNVQEARIFIHERELPPRRIVTGYEYCRLDTLLEADIPSFNGPQLIVDMLVEFIEGEGPRSPPIEIPIGYSVSSRYCVDCRAEGGTTIRPDFWD